MQLSDRERAFENKYAHDEELHFKVRAKRNKLAGLWAAEQLGKSSEEASEYAANIVSTGLAKDNLRERLVQDFNTAGINIAETEIDRKILEFVSASRQHFMNNS